MIFAHLPSRRGISPLIATVLLIVFTISIAAVIVTWLNSVTRTANDEADTAQKSLADCSKVRPIIDSIFVNGTKNVHRISLRNAGDATMTLHTLDVVSEGGVRCSLHVGNITLSKGVSSLQNIGSCAVNCTNFYSARVTTTCGSQSYETTAKSLIVGC